MAIRTDALNLISICTGGGGLDLGVELAIPGARSVCMVEREAFGVSQLVSAMQQGLLAQAPVWSDARTFDGRAWRGAVDGIIGGIPCQPHSLAGKRLEREDPRDLWSTARRIIVQSGAWFVLIENVEGMLSSGGAERVYRDLGRLGFAREVGLFTASEVGATHQRGRTFILAVADPRDTGLQGRKLGRPLGKWDWASAFGPASQLRPAPVDHAIGGRWAAGRDDNGINVGNQPDPASEHDLGDPAGARLHAAAHAGADSGHEGAWARDAQPQRRGGDVGHADVIGELEPDDKDGTEPRSVARDRIGGAGFGLFPPSPGNLDAWRTVLTRSPELEPAFRRVADGLASPMDTARVDRLRMLGNGVVPLEAAYAVRTLATRLASRGSAGAARLVRMMEKAA